MTKKENDIERLTDDVMALICELAIPAGHYVGFRREDAKRLIILIGKAYADGELKIPGEVGRGKAKLDDFSMGTFRVHWDNLRDDLWAVDVKGFDFIALRKEEEG